MPSAAPGVSAICAGSTLYGTFSTRVPSLSMKTARIGSGSRPAALAHGNDHHFGNHRLVRQREEKANCLRNVRGVLQHAGIDVWEAIEQEGRAHAARDHGAHL